jgi:hypothetical protein
MLHEGVVDPTSVSRVASKRRPTRTARPEGRREGQARQNLYGLGVAGSFGFQLDHYKHRALAAKVHFAILALFLRNRPIGPAVIDAPRVAIPALGKPATVANLP